MSALTLVYPRNSLYADYVRGGAGFAVTAGPLLLVPVATPVMVILGLMAGMFGLFLAHTWQCQRLQVVMDEHGLTLMPRQTRLAWEDIDDVALRYFSTRRDREGGWLQLTVKAPAGRLRVDSRLTGFDQLVARAAQAASERGLELTPVTRGNLRHLGLDGGEEVTA